MKIKGYTLHGDYYLSDNVIPNKNWEEACRMKETITLPNGKIVIACTLSKKELETIPQEERGIDNRWYWTSTPLGGIYAWDVQDTGDFYDYLFDITDSNDVGGARLGFHKNEIKQFLDIE